MAGQRLTNVIKLFKGSGASPETFTSSIGNIIDFNGPQFANDRIEVTDGDSPANSKEYLPARQDPGPVQITMHLDPDKPNHVSLFTDASANPPSVRNYRLQFSSDTADYFQGPAFIASIAPSGNTRGAALQMAVGLQPSSLWSLTVGA
jgi:hypothetical protein